MSKLSKSFIRLYSRSISGDVKSFNSIPGPKSLPIIGTLWLYLPIIGKYRLNRLHHNGFLKLREFGPLIREEIIPGVPLVWVFKPEDIETVYRCEGRYPERRSHLILEHYRLSRPKFYNSGGLLPTNGPEWGRLRKIIQKDISKLQNVRVYLPNADKTIKRFLYLRAYYETSDFLPELNRLFLELIGLVCFDESLGCFEESEWNPKSRTSNLIKATETINGVVHRTDNELPLWKYFSTPAYRKFSWAHQYLESTALEFLGKKSKQLEENSKPVKSLSLLDQFLQNKDLNEKDILGVMVDFLLAGIDTTSYTASFALYHLARNEEKQEKMFLELKNLMSATESITEDILQRSTYTKAVMKELHRMNPISIGIGRILAEDAILSNYRVPAGTVVITQNQVSCLLPEYFTKPNEFIPERWLRAAGREQIHPYLVLPFGHGPRSCIARRLAEQNLQLFLMNVVRKFRVKWLGDDLDCVSVQINKPDKPVRVCFETRL
ncbi:hypothetical protein V9T40_003221 [Parthenolecanium corni]|uniref:Cytochrome P450 302A1 n=1 Tax=Parthenolecanium corni TaxID=536013 RepID=A0AAN9TSR8_9HEMI